MENINLPPENWEESRWQELMTSIANFTRRPEENVADIVAGLLAFGKYRGRVVRGVFRIGEDLIYGQSFFCWNPFKPPPLRANYDYITSNRWNLFEGARNDDNAEQRFIEVVPESILRLDLHQLFGLLQSVPIEGIIKLGRES